MDHKLCFTPVNTLVATRRMEYIPEGVQELLFLWLYNFSKGFSVSLDIFECSYCTSAVYFSYLYSSVNLKASNLIIIS